MIRVLIADDETLMRAGIKSILDHAPGVEVVAEASGGPEAVEACRSRAVDVALLDIRMPGDGLAAAAEIARIAPGTRVVMLTTFGEEANVARAMRAGATGFLLKDTGPADLVHAVRVAARGESVLAPRITRALVERHLVAATDDAEARSKVDRLTPAERDVLRVVGTGASNAEVAEELFMSTGTVKAHISSLLTKLGCANRVQAAIVAHEAGLLARPVD